MIEMVLGFVFMGLILLAMSVGVIMGRTPIKGSCGGVGAALGQKDYVCDLCGGDPEKCESQEGQEGGVVKESRGSLGYNAVREN